MSKNTTRKGLALGAAVALVTAGVVSAPAAYAAETLALAPSAGTTYATVTTSTFTLDAGFAGTESTEAQGTLKYRIKNAAGVSMNVDTFEGTTQGATAFAYGTSTPSVLSTRTTSSSDFVMIPAGAPEIGAVQSATIAPQAHTADVVVTVQAWLDLNGDNDMDSNEATSPVRTVTFYDQANVSVNTLAFNDVALGSNTFTVSVTTSPALNYQQVDSGDFDVQATLAGADSGSSAVLAYNSTFEDFRSATITLGENVGAVKALGAQIELESGSGNADLGDPRYYGAVAAGTATSVADPTAVEGDYVLSGALRAGSGSVTLEAVVTVGATVSKVQPVTFVIEEDGNNTLDAGATITVNGVTLKNTSATSKQKISVTVNSVETTETTGTASITVSYTGLKDGNVVDVRSQVTTASAIDTSSDLALTGDDSVVTALVDNVSGALRVVKGSSMSIGYTIVDQFGLTPAAAEGDFRVVISEDSSSAAFSGIQNATNGSATYTVTENSTANNNYTVTATLQEKVVGGSAYAAIAGGAITETTTVSAVSADTASAITVLAADNGDDASKVARFLKDTASGDSEVEQSSVAFESYSGTVLSGTVYGATGAPMAGAEVTLSASGLQFVYSKADAGKVYGAGSITVTADSAGAYSVLVSSNLSGEQTITATSGSATKTEVVDFAVAAATTATKWNIVAPANALPGQTFKVTATLVDKYGNPVSVDTGTATDVPNILTSYAGPGIVFGSLPDETSATGTLSFSVLLGANDTGTATVTLGYSLNADADSADYGDFATSVSVTVGAPVVAQKVNAGSFKGYVAVYAKGYEGHRLSAKVGKDWVVVPSIVNNQENGTLFRVVEFTGAGYDVAVRIYIDRVLVDTINLTTK